MGGHSSVVSRIESLCLQELPIENLHICISDQWSSHASDHRDRLREALRKHLISRGGVVSEELEALSDLSRIPIFSNGSVSISHCPTFGGFVVHQGIGFQLGLDVEKRSRIRKEIAARVCDHDEIQFGPDPTLFWCAKESLFKSRYGMKEVPLVLSDLRVDGWRQVADEVYFFSGRFTQKREVAAGCGLIFSMGERLIAIACAPCAPPWMVHQWVS